MYASTLTGLLSATTFVGASVLLSAAPLDFVSTNGMLMVIGGSSALVVAKFSFSRLWSGLKSTAKSFHSELPSTVDAIDEIYELAKESRRNERGMLALDDMPVSHPFLRKAVRLLVDHYSEDQMEQHLQRERLQTLERNRTAVKIFSALGDVAPAMGMIGTLVGLIQMLGQLDDPAKIGPAMAMALLTTLYGAMLGTMFANPIAEKLKARAQDEALLEQLWMDAVMAIREGKNPRVIKDLLQAYVPHEKRSGEHDIALGVKPAGKEAV